VEEGKNAPNPDRIRLSAILAGALPCMPPLCPDLNKKGTKNAPLKFEQTGKSLATEPVKNISMTKIVISEQYGNFLSQFEWTHFATFTTGYTLTLPSARRAMEGFHKDLSKANPNKTYFFWAAEHYELKDGYHTHALICVPELWQFKNVIQLWQKNSGGAKMGKHQRIDLQKYDSKKGARHYVAKYVTKRLTDYDFLA
jgi:hypothetical protein